MIKNPKHIHLLINPYNNTLAICPSSSGVKDSLKVTYNTDTECEYYSLELMSQLARLNPHLTAEHSYRIGGKTMFQEQLAVFDMKTATILDTMSGLDPSRSTINEL